MTGMFLASMVNGAGTADSKPVAQSGTQEGPLSTHVLDIGIGMPATGIQVKLERQARGGWEKLGQDKTNADGRANNLYPPGKPLEAGVYRLSFDTGAYFQAQGQTTFFPRIEAVFQVEKPQEHYHIPLLLSQFGYSIYRGS
jgi:5-hydroxyisourate hydrolase